MEALYQNFQSFHDVKETDFVTKKLTFVWGLISTLTTFCFTLDFIGWTKTIICLFSSEVKVCQFNKCSLANTTNKCFQNILKCHAQKKTKNKHITNWQLFFLMSLTLIRFKLHSCKVNLTKLIAIIFTNFVENLDFWSQAQKFFNSVSKSAFWRVLQLE